MPITLAQYEFLVQTSGEETAQRLAAESGGIDQTVAGAGGTIVVDQSTGNLTIDTSAGVPNDFYSDGYIAPTPSPALGVPTPVVQPAGLPTTFTDASGQAVLTIGDQPIMGTGGITQTAGLGGALVGGVTLTAAMSLLRLAMRGATRVTSAHWAALPTWAKSLLVAAGIGIGYNTLVTIPGVPGTADVPFIDIFPGGGGPTPSEILGVSVVGGWTANGVQFYRLSDGKLAVQNKHGRWKVWRPKKPIVLYSTGAADIPTLLRADSALNRQSKKIGKMLRRRDPRPAKRTPAKNAGHSHEGPTVIQNS